MIMYAVKGKRVAAVAVLVVAGSCWNKKGNFLAPHELNCANCIW